MPEKPTYRPYLLPTLLVLLVGWGGLALLLNYTLPTLWPRWGFFALLFMAVSGLALPISFFLNRQFSADFEPRVIVRQAVWAGLYAATLAWLQIPRLLNFTIGLWLALGLILIEYLIRWREQSAGKAEDVPAQSPRR